MHVNINIEDDFCLLLEKHLVLYKECWECDRGKFRCKHKRKCSCPEVCFRCEGTGYEPTDIGYMIIDLLLKTGYIKPKVD